MPFDGIDVPGSDQLAKLAAVEKLLATEQQWCKGRLRDAHGRHCLVGAIEAVEGRQVLQRVILQAAREVSGKRYWRIEFFNDDPHTTHADVLAVLQHARENIIDGMIGDPQPWYRRWAKTLRAFSGGASSTGAALGAGHDGQRLMAGEPATFSRSLRPGAYPDRELPRERAVVMELQD
jgi:hypothetical protein